MRSRLESESAAYEAHKGRLLAEHRGKFVLIHGSEIVGVFDTQGEALVAGYQRFGYVDLFTKRLLRRQKPLTLACVLPRSLGTKVSTRR
jgi:hypothetical protein